jgi:hypothetical protein
MDPYPERERLNHPAREPQVYISDEGRLYYSPLNAQISSSSAHQSHYHPPVFTSEDLLNPEIYSARKKRDRWGSWVSIGCSVLLVLGFLDLITMLLSQEQGTTYTLLIVRTASDCMMIFTSWIGFRAAKQLDSNSTRTFYKAMILCGALCVSSYCLMVLYGPFNQEVAPSAEYARKLHEVKYHSIDEYIRSSSRTEPKLEKDEVDCDEENCDKFVDSVEELDCDEGSNKYSTLYEQRLRDADTYVSGDFDEVVPFRYLEIPKEIGYLQNRGRDQEGHLNWNDAYEEFKESLEKLGFRLEDFIARYDYDDEIVDHPFLFYGRRGLYESSNWSDEDDSDEDDYDFSEEQIGRGHYRNIQANSWNQDQDEDDYQENTEFGTRKLASSSWDVDEEEYSTLSSQPWHWANDPDNENHHLRSKFDSSLSKLREVIYPHQASYHSDFDESDELISDVDDDQVYEDTESLYMIFAFFSIALISFSFSLCCFCSSRLYKSSVSYERLMSRPSTMPALGVGQAQAPYQAIPRNASELYPNLAPVGASIPSQ